MKITTNSQIIHAYFKLVRVINSCTTIQHCLNANKCIELFTTQYIDGENGVAYYFYLKERLTKKFHTIRIEYERKINNNSRD